MNIRQFRLSLLLTQDELAKVLGVRKNYVQVMEGKGFMVSKSVKLELAYKL